MTNQTVSDELFAPVSADVELCYQTFGDPSADPLLLVMGLGGPMIWWDAEFCNLLADKGFFVIRYDNRDTGRSSRQQGRVRRADLVRAFLTGRGNAPYSLSDMADDGLGLLDHLGIDSAHVVGISMGGMIVQTMAIEHAARVRSMTSIMSTTGKRSVGWQDPKLLPRLLAGRQVEREAYVNSAVAFAKLIGSPSYPEPVERATKRSEDTFDRGLNGSGVLRHMMAILTQPNRSRSLHSLTIPSQVIHGLSDRMVHVSGGRATSASIPGSELLLVDGMGHDLPAELWESVTDAIRRTADRANPTP
ncbi:alpha/beta hydrolase [Nocardioides sp. Soil797]|nr:alpha/beta hydrolase [Nocardioides sp. Soil797]